MLGLILCATLIFSTYENEFHWFWSPIHFYLLPTVSTALANQNWSVEIFEILKIHSISSNSDKYPPPTVQPEAISFASSSLTSEIASQNTFTLSRWQICHCPTVSSLRASLQRLQDVSIAFNVPVIDDSHYSVCSG